MNFGKLSTTYLKISNLTAEQKNLLADVICGCNLEIFKGSLDGLRNPSDTTHYRYIYYKMGGVYRNDHFTRFRYPSPAHTYHKEVSFEEYISYMREPDYQHNKQKFQVL